MLAPDRRRPHEQLLMLICGCLLSRPSALNKDLRVGISRRMVIAVPKAQLLPDLTRDIRSSAATVSAATGRRDRTLRSAPKQLDVYGRFEP